MAGSPLSPPVPAVAACASARPAGAEAGTQPRPRPAPEAKGRRSLRIVFILRTLPGGRPLAGKFSRGARGQADRSEDPHLLSPVGLLPASPIVRPPGATPRCGDRTGCSTSPPPPAAPARLGGGGGGS